jgi:hypothetical protein
LIEIENAQSVLINLIFSSLVQMWMERFLDICQRAQSNGRKVSSFAGVQEQDEETTQALRERAC